MMFQTKAHYYDILEIRPDASAQDIRNAYLRLKASYRKDNPALYSVLDPSETEEMISKIEEAFQILSDPDARREFDERNGFADRIERKIFAIDRTPPTAGLAPMESGDEMDALTAPATDFEGMNLRGESTSTSSKNTFQLPTESPREASSFLDTLPRTDFTLSTPEPTPSSGFIERRQTATAGRRENERNILPPSNPLVDKVIAEIASETEWRGSTLRRIREVRRYSLDDIASITKISKNYLMAIEEEAFAKLPAPVFVRGFLLQFARTLKIPQEPVASAYLARMAKRPGVG